MTTPAARTCLLALLLLGAVPLAHAGTRAATTAHWTEGVNYYLIDPAQPKRVPANKVEVTEVFSFACPYCDQFYPVVDRLKASLPRYAVMDYVPASFSKAEDWPMFQRAYYAARALGVERRTHDAMFNAVWNTGQLAVVVRGTDQLRHPAPRIQDAARFYQRAAGVNPKTFLAVADSFTVDARMREADQYIMACGIEGTPSIVVDGKYRITARSAGGYDQVIQLVDWLVAREHNGR